MHTFSNPMDGKKLLDLKYSSLEYCIIITNNILFLHFSSTRESRRDKQQLVENPYIGLFVFNNIYYFTIFCIISKKRNLVKNIKWAMLGISTYKPKFES